MWKAGSPITPCSLMNLHCYLHYLSLIFILERRNKGEIEYQIIYRWEKHNGKNILFGKLLLFQKGKGTDRSLTEPYHVASLQTVSDKSGRADRGWLSYQCQRNFFL